jgi:hypothetical protein
MIHLPLGKINMCGKNTTIIVELGTKLSTVWFPRKSEGRPRKLKLGFYCLMLSRIKIGRCALLAPKYVETKLRSTISFIFRHYYSQQTNRALVIVRQRK